MMRPVVALEDLVFQLSADQTDGCLVGDLNTLFTSDEDDDGR